MNLFYFITLYLWDFIFSIIDKNEIKILRTVCKDFRNILINYWIQNIPYISNKEVNNYFISNQKLNFNIRFIILQDNYYDLKNIMNNKLLILSCKNGYLELVKLLIKNGTNINEKDDYMSTALINASRFGHLKIVKFLVGIGANINEKDYYNCTTLLYACKYGYLKIVQLLIKIGANINQKNNNGTTELIYASEYGHLEIVKLLVKIGADINQRDNFGIDALQHAKQKNWIEIIKYLKTLI